MAPSMHKLAAVAEVVVVAFIVVPYLTLGIYRLFPGFESWQAETLGFLFPVFVYVVEVAVALGVILARRKKLVDYGIDFRNPKYHLDIMLVCLIPVMLSNVPLGMGVNHKTWPGALIMAGMNILLLLALGWLLRHKPSGAPAAALAAGLFVLPGLPLGLGSVAGQAVVTFLTYALFVGFGEEILYRGYMQSRLNEAFGKPYRFFGVSWGWGIVLASLLFGLTHVGIVRWILGLNTEVTLAWGFWTVFGGLIFGFVREKSGSILAPALLHGLPQAIASAAMLFLR